MHCVKSRMTIEESIKKSRFIGVIIPCSSEQEALRNLEQLYQDHPNANHIAFAYRIQTPSGLACRFHDAGEPTGTAGRPIFHHLEGKNLINLMIAVIRYFGGIKLGAGGLTRAYGNAAKLAIEAADVIDFVSLEQVQLDLAYSQMQKLEYLLKKLQGRILEQHFSEQVSVIVELPAEEKNGLLQELSENR
ncbi:MAG: YigZ family protein [Gammaproteobacteria bacterium]